MREEINPTGRYRLKTEEDIKREREVVKKYRISGKRRNYIGKCQGDLEKKHTNMIIKCGKRS